MITGWFIPQSVWLYVLLLSCRAPSGMIESTPQLFGNAWRVSSACVSSLSAPQLDPCDMHQQAGQFLSFTCVVLMFSIFYRLLTLYLFHLLVWWLSAIFQRVNQMSTFYFPLSSGLRLRQVWRPEPGSVFRLPRVPQSCIVPPAVSLRHL